MSYRKLQSNPMMQHLCGALEAKKDIGHYGRLVFAMVARHFLKDDELIGLLAKNPNFDETQAKALVLQVQARDYNPPKREKIMEWQAQQEFPICPDGNDPGACNLYRDLEFPNEVYEKIGEFYEQKAEAGTS